MNLLVFDERGRRLGTRLTRSRAIPNPHLHTTPQGSLSRVPRTSYGVVPAGAVVGMQEYSGGRASREVREIVGRSHDRSPCAVSSGEDRGRAELKDSSSVW